MIVPIRTFGFLIVLLFLSGLTCFGQIDITYPVNRAVFQRDNNNSGVIHIAGNYKVKVDRIEAQLVPIQGGNATGWISIQSTPQGGFYNGSLNATGGWYRLEVRGWRGDQVVASTEVSRVGIGEVFVIAGQSNGQGYFNLGALGASDDRVNCFNYYNLNDPGDQLRKPEFSHLDANSYIAPRGNSAWCWGRLGDQLANRLGVPILFYNVAWYGAGCSNWRESISGITYSFFATDPFLPSGMPYANLRLVLKDYVSLSGIRAVLWHQGETDNYINASKNTYVDNLKTVINQSRSDAGKNLSWVVARVSYGEQWGGVDNTIIEAQNDVIASTNNTFYGPETDPIRERSDGLHFSGDGLTQLGDAWNSSLSNDFFSQSQPFAALPPPRVVVSCTGNNTLKIDLESNYSSVAWNNGQNSTSITVGNGNYQAKLIDNSGNILYTPEIRISETIQPAQPAIELEGSNPVCLGNTLTLVSSSNDNPVWNTGQHAQRLLITSEGDYSVSVASVYGCESRSNPLRVTFLSSPLPATPKITVSGATTFCEGGQVTLQSDASVKTRWSTGQEGSTLIAKSSGDYRAMALDNQGCFSPPSDAVKVNVNPLPSPPVISSNGATTFCAGENVTLTSNYDTGNTWSTTTTSKSITVSQTGQYSVNYKDANGCESASSPTFVQVKELPATPTITALRPTVFCEGDFTQLQSSEAPQYNWNTGLNRRHIDVLQSGDYWLTVTGSNGCTSEKSAVFQVVSNPNPAKPTILPSGNTRFCANEPITLQSSSATTYRWSNGASTRNIIPIESGYYFLKTQNEFNCLSEQSDAVFIEVLSIPPPPTITAEGSTLFCEGGEVLLHAQQPGSYLWNEGSEGQSITVKETGNYFTKIKGGNGCYSMTSNSIYVDAKPIPSRPIIQKNGPYTLEVSNESQTGEFIWQKNGSILPFSTPLIQITEPGSYQVEQIFSYSPTVACISEKSEVYILNTPSEGSRVVVFPNPSTNGKVYLETSENFNWTSITLFDSRGVAIKTFSGPIAPRKSIDLSGLSAGTYLIKVSSDNFTMSQKLILIH